jgi:hypothetical protein
VSLGEICAAIVNIDEGLDRDGEPKRREGRGRAIKGICGGDKVDCSVLGERDGSIKTRASTSAWPYSNVYGGAAFWE